MGFKDWRRKRLMAEQFDPGWLVIIERNVPYYHRLRLDMRQRMQGLVQVFLDEKSFEGCGGIEISDEIRVTVAAHACILLLGLDAELYPKLRSVLLYPGTYVAPFSRRGPGGIVTEGLQARAGESWSHGNVVLAWGDVLRCASPNPTGRNVVLHEFAHQLDSESGANEGAPVLPHKDMYANWARVLGKEYQLLIDAAEQGKPTLLDQYGATSPAEFFAVATECFFEQPVEMSVIHPELYEQLKLYYRQDPAFLAGG
jgi:MtfA peptidase